MKKETSKIKQVGIYMDHAQAKFIEPDTTGKIHVIQSALKSMVRIDGEESDGTRLGNFRSTNNESHKHNREQNEIHAYYKQLAEQLKPYDEIFIFGPSTAHNELHNYLINEKKLSGKKISTEKADYITENQIKERVRNFFASDKSKA